MTAETGLRERKKQRTREQIAETARRMFGERGFERVTVAEIARAAEVAEKTVFNYFPTKEDLVFWRLESFEQELLDSIRDREPGESALDGFARFLRRPQGMLAEREISDELRAVTRMIAESPALLAREQRVFEDYTESMAVLLAAETGAEEGEVEPWVAANAFMGVHRALVTFARGRILAGAGNPELAEEVRERIDAAIALLAGGFGGYAVR